MANVFILNGHQPYPFSKGELNAAITSRIADYFTSNGNEVRLTETAKGYDVEAEINNHLWADVVIFQFPVNWMGVPWPLKKYMDEVYTAGMDGRLTVGDGRTSEEPKKNYGMGGTQGDTTYMLSVTFNAPKEAFNDPAEPLFAGRSVDDLLLPQHMNAQFFAMKPKPTFAVFDVMKNPDVENDFARLAAHLKEHFPATVGA